MQKNIHAGLPLTLKAAGVKKISTLGLQVLAAAKATANRSDLKFDIIAPSPEFERACADTGLNGLLGAGG